MSGAIPEPYDPGAPIEGVFLVCHETGEDYPITVPDGDLFGAMRMALTVAPYAGPLARFHFSLTPLAAKHLDIQGMNELFGSRRYRLTGTGRSFCGLPIIVQESVA